MTRGSRILYRAHKQCGTHVLIRTPRFLLFVLWIAPKCHMESLPVLWQENRFNEGNSELLITVLLLKSRIKVVRAGKGVRTGQDHLHKEDFTANFSSAWKLKEQWNHCSHTLEARPIVKNIYRLWKFNPVYLMWSPEICILINNPRKSW